MSDEPQTIPGAAARLGQSLISALPAPFLLLMLINVAFLAVVLWFVDDQMESRTVLAEKIIDRCMDVAIHKP